MRCPHRGIPPGVPPGLDCAPEALNALAQGQDLGTVFAPAVAQTPLRVFALQQSRLRHTTQHLHPVSSSARSDLAGLVDPKGSHPSAPHGVAEHQVLGEVAGSSHNNDLVASGFGTRILSIPIRGVQHRIGDPVIHLRKPSGAVVPQVSGLNWCCLGP